MCLAAVLSHHSRNRYFIQQFHVIVANMTLSFPGCVAGMKCGGCVGHVKKILEGQLSVSVASVNLATETAMVRVMVPKALSSEDSTARLLGIGEQLAQVRVGTIHEPNA